MLLRHDYVTLYANGIRYLEKAPLSTGRWRQHEALHALRRTRPRALAAAARIPLALTMLALALLVEAFARRIFTSARAGLYAALIMLSSFGIFLFTRMLIPDAMVCLWITLAMYALWRTEELGRKPEPAPRPDRPQAAQWRAPLSLRATPSRACALNVLTKGLIGVVFPVAIAVLYYPADHARPSRHPRIACASSTPLSSLAVFLAHRRPLAHPRRPRQPHPGTPTPRLSLSTATGIVPLPTDGNVRGWFWFYFMNEHLLRYLNLRVPHDYDTAPLWLFWGLCFLWLMPWSAFVFKPLAWACPIARTTGAALFAATISRSRSAACCCWSSSGQRSYCSSSRSPRGRSTTSCLRCLPRHPHRRLARTRVTRQMSLRIPSPGSCAHRCIVFPLVFGASCSSCQHQSSCYTSASPPNTDLSTLLTQNPDDYALSLGHFMDLTGPAIALFRFPLMIAALSLFLGPLTALAPS
jgi:hypothetical protein